MNRLKKLLGLTPKDIPYNPLDDIEELFKLTHAFRTLHVNRKYNELERLEIFEGVGVYRDNTHGTNYFNLKYGEISCVIHNGSRDDLRSTYEGLKNLPSTITYLKEVLNYLYSI